MEEKDNFTEQEEKDLIKTIQQQSGEIPRDLTIDKMTMKQIEELERDIQDTIDYIKKEQGCLNILQANVINKINSDISKRKIDLKKQEKDV